MVQAAALFSGRDLGLGDRELGVEVEFYLILQFTPQSPPASACRDGDKAPGAPGARRGFLLRLSGPCP